MRLRDSHGQALGQGREQDIVQVVIGVPQLAWALQVRDCLLETCLIILYTSLVEQEFKAEVKLANVEPAANRKTLQENDKLVFQAPKLAYMDKKNELSGKAFAFYLHLLQW